MNEWIFKNKKSDVDMILGVVISVSLLVHFGFDSIPGKWLFQEQTENTLDISHTSRSPFCVIKTWGIFVRFPDVSDIPDAMIFAMASTS